MTTATRPDGTLTAEALEGRLLGQRRLLEALLTVLCRDRTDAAAFLDRLEADLGFQDHQEDPGFEPDSAFALERHADLEVRRILDRAREGLAAPDSPDPEGRSPSAIA